MSSREQIRLGKGRTKSRTTKVDPLPPIAQDSMLPTIVLPNAKRICTVILFFVGCFSIGFGAGFGIGYASKECV